MAWMVSLPHGTYDHDAQFSIAPDERPLSMIAMRNTMGDRIGRGDAVAELAGVFMSFVETPFGSLRSMLHDNGVALPLEPGRVSPKIKDVEAAFAKVDPMFSQNDRAERLIIQGMKALGLPHDSAESLFDFEKKRAKRMSGTAR
jgi:hypothetical protein